MAESNNIVPADEQPRPKRRVSPNVGRPSKLTTETLAEYIKVLAVTCNGRIAAQRIGVAFGTICRWMAEGDKARSGIKREFYEGVLRAKADFLATTVAQHHRLSIGGIVKRPKLVEIPLENGAVQRTTQIQRGPDGEIIWEEHWIDPSERGMEWELSRLDPEIYANPANTAANVNDGVNIETPAMSELLKLYDNAPADLLSRCRPIVARDQAGD
jgi:hypothetical protein